MHIRLHKYCTQAVGPSCSHRDESEKAVSVQDFLVHWMPD